MPYCNTARICVRKSSVRGFASIWGGRVFPYDSFADCCMLGRDQRMHSAVRSF
ncbi:unnamed protein product [Amoebophrya sp. A120]|nr:unnamed protein product [Amoebophrya sp. A120]|eukprot:GSA120T00013927001.1